MLHARRAAARFGYALFLIPCLALLYAAAAGGWNDLVRFALEQKLDRWDRQGRVVDAVEWEAARDEALALDRVNPRDAHAALTLGRVYEWRAWQQRRQRRHARERRREADAYYLQTLERRPSWGRGWAQLALNRAKIDPAAAQTLRALERAFVVDPYLPSAQIPTMEAAMLTWAHLSPGLRDETFALARRMDDNYRTRPPLQRLAEKYGWRPQLGEALAQRSGD